MIPVGLELGPVSPTCLYKIEWSLKVIGFKLFNFNSKNPLKMENEPSARQRIASLLEDVNENVSTCCFEMFESRNKIVPSVLQENTEDFDFIEITPQRRIRVIHLKPFQNFSASEEAETEEMNDEEYWFENAAPKRLPVIQPQPQPQVNRIINKFEPREPPSVAKGSPSKNFHDNFISPGRLPRKTLVTKLMETDDFEDDQTVRYLDNLISESCKTNNYISSAQRLVKMLL